MRECALSEWSTAGINWLMAVGHSKDEAVDVRERKVDDLEAVFMQHLKTGHVAVVRNSIDDASNSVGDEVHRAGTAWNGGDRDRLDLPAMGQTTEVGLSVHDKLATLQVVKPPVVGHLMARGQAVVGGRDDAVLMIEGDGPDLAARILRAQRGGAREDHRVFVDVWS
jgi:hypothetical protein